MYIYFFEVSKIPSNVQIRTNGFEQIQIDV